MCNILIRWLEGKINLAGDILCPDLLSKCFLGLQQNL